MANMAGVGLHSDVSRFGGGAISFLFISAALRFFGTDEILCVLVSLLLPVVEFARRVTLQTDCYLRHVS